jgi:hypothetical protein
MTKDQKNAVKEIEARINLVKGICNEVMSELSDEWVYVELDKIDDLLFDIQDFINDLKDN